MIELDHVTKAFGDGAARTVAVDDLTLSVAAGEIVALVGSSGSGKTTTLRMINRLIEPTSGRITVNGRDVSALAPHELRRGIGYVIQQSGLFPHRTVIANVATVPRLLGWDKRRATARAREMMELVGLDASLADRYPAQLSGGQQQRVGVARALAADPPVLLMDEPFGAVDPIVRAQLQREFARLQRELDKTVVFVTHDVDEAILLGDRIAVLEHGGRLAQLASPAELLASPASPFVADFLGRRTVRYEEGVAVGYHIESAFVAPPTPVGLAGPAGAEVGGVSLLAEAPLWSGRQLAGNWDVIWYYTAQHARYTVIAVGLGFAMALPLGYVAVRRRTAYPVLLAATNVIYAIPALTLFVLLSPWLGYINDKPIVVAMALYTLVILVRNIVEGVRAVPEPVLRAADGMGYRPQRRFVAVELPLALPGIIAGLRLAVVSTVSLISVGAVIGRGALGRMFADGYQRQIGVELWAAMVATMALALALDLVVYVVGRAMTPWTRVREARA